MYNLCLFSVTSVQEMNGISDTVGGPLESFGSGVVRILCVTKTGTSWLVLAQRSYAQQLLVPLFLMVGLEVLFYMLLYRYMQ